VLFKLKRAAFNLGTDLSHYYQKVPPRKVFPFSQIIIIYFALEIEAQFLLLIPRSEFLLLIAVTKHKGTICTKTNNRIASKVTRYGFN
jgi:hypothetical protein